MSIDSGGKQYQNAAIHVSCGETRRIAIWFGSLSTVSASSTLSIGLRPTEGKSVLAAYDKGFKTCIDYIHLRSISTLARPLISTDCLAPGKAVLISQPRPSGVPTHILNFRSLKDIFNILNAEFAPFESGPAEL
jgi:hypothetical protein